MGQSLEVLSRRTTSMQGIRSVVHTMKTLSVINSVPYEHAARAIGVYHDNVLQGLHAFISQQGGIDIATSEDDTQIIIIFGSDHGLCGNYNQALASHVAEQNVAQDVTLLCVGARLENALTDQGFEVSETFFPPASVDGIGRLSNLLTQRLDQIRRESGRSGLSASLAYFARDDDGGQTPKVVTLLPLDPQLVKDLQAKPWTSRSRPYFSMPPDDLFLALIRGHLFASLFRAAAEALVTENAARLALMQQAEQSVDDRLEELMSSTRALRQSEITTELLDVVIGFETLKKKAV